MDKEILRQILQQVKNGDLCIDDAYFQLEKLPFENINFAKIDNHRAIRKGYPEVIFSEGKTLNQIQKIIERISQGNNNILATRATSETYEAIKEVENDCVYYEDARIVVIKPKPPVSFIGNIVIITAGTSDIPVAEEAGITAETFG
ncbi:MAG: 1-(5-phosphoribosyl)-5-amino-4-imidazole-carboxylate carboxylase, partial [Desulfobacterales bacterium]|nr:1-(5-phosphoribosyl)-5-amino-4-imidazole-carboxylate carboxylase [Desulfobacterales bacterium]